jgi:hypothetical protein
MNWSQESVEKVGDVIWRATVNQKTCKEAAQAALSVIAELREVKAVVEALARFNKPGGIIECDRECKNVLIPIEEVQAISKSLAPFTDKGRVMMNTPETKASERLVGVLRNMPWLKAGSFIECDKKLKFAQIPIEDIQALSEALADCHPSPRASGAQETGAAHTVIEEEAVQIMLNPHQVLQKRTKITEPEQQIDSSLKDSISPLAQTELSDFTSLLNSDLLQTIEEMEKDIMKAKEALESCEEEYNEYLDFKGASGMEQFFDKQLVEKALAALEKYGDKQ